MLGLSNEATTNYKSRPIPYLFYLCWWYNCNAFCIFCSMTFWCFVVPHCCRRVGPEVTLTTGQGCWVLGLVVPHGSVWLCGKVTIVTTHCFTMFRPIVSKEIWVIICLIITAITKKSFSFLMSLQVFFQGSLRGGFIFTLVTHEGFLLVMRFHV